MQKEFNFDTKIQAVSSVRNLANGRVWTLVDIRAEVEKAQAVLRQKGYRPQPVVSIAFNRRLKSACGRTHKSASGAYEMDFSVTYIENATPEGIRNTAAHEAVHTIPGCLNHGPSFRSAAAALRSAGYSVTRTNKDAVYREYRQKENAEHPTYYVLCRNCGVSGTQRQRLSPILKTIMTPGQRRYRCNRCNSNDLRVIQKFPDGTVKEISSI